MVSPARRATLLPPLCAAAVAAAVGSPLANSNLGRLFSIRKQHLLVRSRLARRLCRRPFSSRWRWLYSSSACWPGEPWGQGRALWKWRARQLHLHCAPDRLHHAAGQFGEYAS